MYYTCSFIFKYTFSLSDIVWLLSSSTQASESEWVEVSEDDDDDDDDEENEDDDDDDESNSDGTSEENEDDDEEEEVPILISKLQNKNERTKTPRFTFM